MGHACVVDEYGKAWLVYAADPAWHLCSRLKAAGVGYVVLPTTTLLSGRLLDVRWARDNYVLTGVLFAVVLFFAGLTAKVASPQVANGMAYGTIALSIIGIVCLLIQPQRLPI